MCEVLYRKQGRQNGMGSEVVAERKGTEQSGTQEDRSRFINGMGAIIVALFFHAHA